MSLIVFKQFSEVRRLIIDYYSNMSSFFFLVYENGLNNLAEQFLNSIWKKKKNQNKLGVSPEQIYEIDCLFL